MSSYTRTELFGIARYQKQILRLVLWSIIVILGLWNPLPPPIDALIGLLALLAMPLIGILGALVIYRLAKALKDPTPWLYAICAFIPTVNTVTLLIINTRATAVLRRNNITVEIMGVPQDELQELRNQSDTEMEKWTEQNSAVRWPAHVPKQGL